MAAGLEISRKPRVCGWRAPARDLPRTQDPGQCRDIAGIRGRREARVRRLQTCAGGLRVTSQPPVETPSFCSIAATTPFCGSKNLSMTGFQPPNFWMLNRVFGVGYFFLSTRLESTER